MRVITRSLVVGTGARIGVLLGPSDAGPGLHLLCAWGAAAPGNDLLRPLPADGFVGRVLQSDHAVVESLDEGLAATLHDLAAGAHLTHGAGAAIRAPGGPTGVLCLGFSGEPVDPEPIAWLIEGYAGLAGLCLDDAKTLDGLLGAIREDGLTGCLNHAAIRGELDFEIERSARHHKNLSCCCIDLDDFKYLNDRHGQSYGDGVLAEVAAVLRRDVRLADTVGRYGGDEFMAVLPDTDERTACLLACRLRHLVNSLTLGAGVSLDVSIGVAQWHPGWDVEQTLEAAELALAKAKNAGGGMVLSAGDVMRVEGPRFVRAGRPAY